jgi:hypothetical protein
MNNKELKVQCPDCVDGWEPESPHYPCTYCGGSGYIRLDQCGFAVHTLASGETVCLTSPHGARFSDGTVAEKGATREAAALVEVTPVSTEIRPRVFRTTMRLSRETIAILKGLSNAYDWVLVPFMVISAMRDQELCDQLPNVVAGNATPETRRARPSEKVWDINRWAC